MNTATRYGNYCALIGIALILGLHYSGTSALFTKGISSIVSSFVEVVFIFLAIRVTREKEFGGYIDFRNAAKAGLTMVLINGILLAFFLYLYYQFIDTNFIGSYLPDYEKWARMAGQKDEEIKKLSNALSTGFSPISAAWSSFSTMVVLETFIALIAARILKREPPSPQITE